MTAGYLVRRGNRPGRRRAAPRDHLRRRRPQGAGPPAVRGAPGHRAGDGRVRRRARDRRRARRARRARRRGHRTSSTSSAQIDRQFHSTIARACGNPMLHEVHAKALAALFGSGEFSSLLYAEVNRAEVNEIITLGDRRAPDHRRRGRARPTPARPSPRSRATSTTSSAAWWSAWHDHRDTVERTRR